MTAPSPDLFPQPFHAFQDSARPTPPEMGGFHEPDVDAGLTRPGTPRRRNPLAAGLQRRLESRRPRRIWLQGTGTADGTNPTIIRVGAPKPGFVRSVRRLTIGPINYLNVATGPTRVIVMTAPPSAQIVAPISASRVISSTTSWPAEGTWGRGELVLEASDELVVVVIGGTANQVLTVGGQAEETAATDMENYEL